MLASLNSCNFTFLSCLNIRADSFVHLMNVLRFLIFSWSLFRFPLYASFSSQLSSKHQYFISLYLPLPRNSSTKYKKSFRVDSRIAKRLYNFCLRHNTIYTIMDVVYANVICGIGSSLTTINHNYSCDLEINNIERNAHDMYHTFHPCIYILV